MYILFSGATFLLFGKRRIRSGFHNMIPPLIAWYNVYGLNMMGKTKITDICPKGKLALFLWSW